MRGGGVKWPHEDSVITSVTQLWDKGSSPSHLAPPGAACIRRDWIQVPRGHSPFSYCLFLPPFFFSLRSFSLLGTKHPAASGPKPRLGLRQAGHILPCGPLGCSASLHPSRGARCRQGLGSDTWKASGKGSASRGGREVWTDSLAQLRGVSSDAGLLKTGVSFSIL